MIEYLIFQKARQTLESFRARPAWDVFISAYNDSDRVRDVFSAAPAREKHWCIAAEYGYQKGECPDGAGTFWVSGDEASAVTSYFDQSRIDIANARICVDITGFMRPHILFLVKYLQMNRVSSFDVVYAEPLRYSNKEHTQFALGDVIEVRGVYGYEGSHTPDTEGDLLAIGAGYDRDLVSRVVGHKEAAKVAFLYGFPSLSPDMYQQSVLQMWPPTSAVQGREFGDGPRFCGANDPFATAAALSELWKDAQSRLKTKNLYLSPLGTKPQTLGFSLFYLKELQSAGASVLFPFTAHYSRETSSGVGRVWTYNVELS